MRTSAPFRLICRFRQVSPDAINVFSSIVCCDDDDDDLDDDDALKYNKLSYHKQVTYVKLDSDSYLDGKPRLL